MNNKPIKTEKKKHKNTTQPRTTLKWGIDGELSAIDMARILDRLSKPELTECELACEVNEEREL